MGLCKAGEVGINMPDFGTSLRQSVPNNIDNIKLWQINYRGSFRGLYSGTMYDVISHLYHEEELSNPDYHVVMQLHPESARTADPDLDIYFVAYESLKSDVVIDVRVIDADLCSAVEELVAQNYYVRNGNLVSFIANPVMRGVFTVMIRSYGGIDTVPNSSNITTTTTQKEETTMTENNNVTSDAQEKAESFKKSLTSVLGMQQSAWKDAAQLRAGEIVVNTLAKIARKGMGVMASAWIGKDEPGNIKNHIFKVVIASLAAMAANMLNNSRWRRLANAAIVAAYTDAMRQVPVEKWLSQAIESVDIRRAEAVLDGKGTEDIDQSALIAELSARLAAIEAEKATFKK